MMMYLIISEECVTSNPQHMVIKYRDTSTPELAGAMRMSHIKGKVGQEGRVTWEWGGVGGGGGSS